MALTSESDRASRILDDVSVPWVGDAWASLSGAEIDGILKSSVIMHACDPAMPDGDSAGFSISSVLNLAMDTLSGFADSLDAVSGKTPSALDFDKAVAFGFLSQLSGYMFVKSVIDSAVLSDAYEAMSLSDGNRGDLQ